jgi:hypothetical protein
MMITLVVVVHTNILLILQVAINNIPIHVLENGPLDIMDLAWIGEI